MPDDDLFAELDAEIATHVSAEAKRKEAEKLKKASNNRFATAKQRALSKEQYELLRKEIEAAQWETEAFYAMFSEQRCDGCGSVHRIFLQYMELQFLLRLRSTKRFIPAAKPDKFSPRRVMLQQSTTHICSDCCSEHGFDFTTSEDRSIMRLAGAITVNSAYQQEDLNEEGND